MLFMFIKITHIYNNNTYFIKVKTQMMMFSVLENMHEM